jgi:hypothetical protein
MIFNDLLSNIEIPKFVRVLSHRKAQSIVNIPQSVFDALERERARDYILPDMRVCIAVGSREIAHFPAIVRAVVEYVKFCDAKPFLIPAMGSHGGSTAEGQKRIIEGFGITEKTMGAPIYASMETVEIGRTPSGMSVHLDRYADQADFIIPIGRVKPHTDFRGKIESGLCKMLVIGMGKQHGAYICHRYGFANMPKNIWEISQVVVGKKPNMIALAIIENACSEIYELRAVPAKRIHEVEPGLLEIAREQLGHLPFDEADVLIVDEIGKEISGAGMDPNVTGRYMELPKQSPFFQSIAVLDVTNKSHGNCGGIGAADVTTRRLFDKFDFEQTYPNAITVANGLGTKIPPVMPNDMLAIKFALRCVTHFTDARELIRAVWIKNTCTLDTFFISEAMLEIAHSIPTIEIVGKPMSVHFDEQGNVCEWREEDKET